MESYDASRIKAKSQDLLEKLYGDAFSVTIVNIKAQGDEIIVRGRFSDSWLGDPDKHFTVTFDKKGNVLNYSVDE